MKHDDMNGRDIEGNKLTLSQFMMVEAGSSRRLLLSPQGAPKGAPFHSSEKSQEKGREEE